MCVGGGGGEARRFVNFKGISVFMYGFLVNLKLIFGVSIK